MGISPTRRSASILCQCLRSWPRVLGAATTANADVGEPVRIMSDAELGAEQPALGVDVAHASTRAVTVEPKA